MMGAKPRYLITTADESTWVFDQPVLFLGSWCLLQHREHVWSKLDYKIVPYHWDDPKEMNKDAEVVRSVYINLLQTLSKVLNEEHDLNWSDRAWRIIIGPFLMRYIEVLFDRWRSIQYALIKYDISGASIDHPVWNEIISKDFDEFGEDTKTDKWNYYIFSEFLLNSQKIKLNKKPPQDEFGYQSSEDDEEEVLIAKESILKKIKRILFGMTKKILHSHLYFLISKFIGRNNYYYLYNTYINGKLNVLKLSMSLGDWPILNLDHPAPDLSGIGCGNRDYLKTLEGDICGNFDEVARFFLPKLMPLIYLEGFNDLLRCSNRARFPKDIKSIITTIGIWKDEVFKVWVAQRIQNGASLIVGQHGAEYGTSLFSFFEEHEKDISDKYLTWGWSYGSEKVIAAPAPILINKKNCIWKKDGNISIICSQNARYLSQMHPNLKYGAKAERYLIQIKSLLELLKSEVKGLLTVKLFPGDNARGNPMGVKLKKSFPWVHFLPLKSSLEGLLSSSRLSIHTYDGTTFLETIGVGRPCMIVFNPEITPIRKNAQPFYNKLEEVGIYHKTPESASKKIIEIYKDIENWWESNEVIDARELFCNEFALTVDEPLRYFRDIILEKK
jgi:putative transferase (TIGR04331 family)